MSGVPIACSLDAGETGRRAQEWAGLASMVRGTEQSDRMLTIRFSSPSKDELERLVEAEGQCCGFASWDVADRGEEVVLTITSDELGISALAQSFSLWGLAS